MVQMFRDSGFPVTTTLEDGLSHVVLSLRETERFTDVAATRSRLAATASMKGFFEPRVVAVVGANRERGKIGAEILHNIMAAGFTGTVVPVHPTAGVVQGLTRLRTRGGYPGASRPGGDCRPRRAGARRG